MPIAFAERMVVKMKRGVTRAEMAACVAGGGGLNIDLTTCGRDCCEGLSQRFAANSASTKMCAASSDRENGRERNTSSPTNRQFTVHLNRNCLVNSNARDKYALALTMLKGHARSTWHQSDFPNVVMCRAYEIPESGP